jgi:hypothetical protein
MRKMVNPRGRSFPLLGKLFLQTNDNVGPHKMRKTDLCSQVWIGHRHHNRPSNLKQLLHPSFSQFHGSIVQQEIALDEDRVLH